VSRRVVELVKVYYGKGFIMTNETIVITAEDLKVMEKAPISSVVEKSEVIIAAGTKEYRDIEEVFYDIKK